MSYKSIVAMSSLVFGVFLCLPSFSLSKDAPSKMPNLVKVCAKECPGAKTNDAVLACAETKEKDPAFQKTKCGVEHAKYEKSSGGHHDEHSHEEGEAQH